jgi:hypothetical protein
MKDKHTDDALILAVYPAVRGFGFALFHGAWTPIDWGFRHVDGDKNTACLDKVRALIEDYAPDTLLLEDHRGAGSRRCPRVTVLIDEIARLAMGKGISVARYSLPEFPPQLPPERKIWLPEDTRMSIFDAVSLIFTHFYFEAIRPGTTGEDTSLDPQPETHL